jgi:hypothetical protein
LAAHPGVGSRPWQSVLVAHLEHEALRAVAGEGLDVPVGSEDTYELVASSSSGQAFEDALDLCQVEQPLHFRLVHSVSEAVFGEDVGEVDEGAGEAGDWDVVDEGALFGVDEARAVQGEALPHLP